MYILTWVVPLTYYVHCLLAGATGGVSTGEEIVVGGRVGLGERRWQWEEGKRPAAVGWGDTGGGRRPPLLYTF